MTRRKISMVIENSTKSGNTVREQALSNKAEKRLTDLSQGEALQLATHLKCNGINMTRSTSRHNSIKHE